MMPGWKFMSNLKMRHSGTWLAILLLSGCTGGMIQNTASKSAPVYSASEPASVNSETVSETGLTSVAPAKQVIGQAERTRISLILELLDRADTAIKATRYAQPADDNAMIYYRRVLALQPGFEEAEQGLEKMVDRYLAWSNTALRQGRLEAAQDYLSLARLVEPSSSKVAQAALSLKSKKVEGVKEGVNQVEDLRYTPLDKDQLRVRSQGLTKLLARVADTIRTENARVTIEAPTDSQGRWIYQQLNQRHEEYRVRANFRRVAQPGVRLLY